MLDAFSIAPVVQDWQWGRAARIRCELEQAYASHADEQGCVQAIVRAIDDMPSVAVPLNARLSLTLDVEAAFLHGSRSQVQFRVGGAVHQRELADLLVPSTFVHKERLAFQRVCLIQAKRLDRNTGQAAARYGVRLTLGSLCCWRAFPSSPVLPVFSPGSRPSVSGIARVCWVPMAYSPLQGNS